VLIIIEANRGSGGCDEMCHLGGWHDKTMYLIPVLIHWTIFASLNLKEYESGSPEC